MNAFAFLLSMTGLFFLFCFLPLWRHFAVCDQTTALPCCTTSHCHLECHSADGQRKQVLLTLHFLIENYLWEKGKDLALLPEGASLPRGQTVRPKAKGVPLNNKAPLKVIPIYSCCRLQQISPRVFIHQAAVHWEGQAGTAAQLVQCLLVGQSRSVIRLSPMEAEEKKTWAWCKAIPSYINSPQGLGKPLAKIPRTQIPPGHASCP